MCWLESLELLALDFNYLGGPLPRLKPPRRSNARRGSNASAASALTEGSHAFHPIPASVPEGPAYSDHLDGHVALQTLRRHEDAPPDNGFDPDLDSGLRGGLRGLVALREVTRIALDDGGGLPLDCP